MLCLWCGSFHMVYYCPSVRPVDTFCRYISVQLYSVPVCPTSIYITSYSCKRGSHLRPPIRYVISNSLYAHCAVGTYYRMRYRVSTTIIRHIFVTVVGYAGEAAIVVEAEVTTYVQSLPSITTPGYNDVNLKYPAKFRLF